jgi:hypothetical protein
MTQGNRFVGLIVVVIIGICLQALLVFGDCRNTPADTARNFSKAYYNLDPALADYLCDEIVSAEIANPVDGFMQKMEENAMAQGHDANYLRSKLYHVHTKTTLTEEGAEVHLTATRRKNINPVFAVIGKIFSLGKTYSVDRSLDLIEEDGKWKVCGEPFAEVDI